VTRVLVLNERDPAHPRAGGAEIHVMEIFSRLAAGGMSVTLAASAFPGCAARGEAQGVEIWRRGRVPSYYARVAATCARETRRGHFDVVVDCLNKLPFHSPLYSAAPVVALCHHLFGSTAFQQVAWPIAAGVVASERLIPLSYRNTPFVVISESTRDDLIARGIDPDRIEVQHPGIRRPEASPLPIARRGPNVIYVGRLERYKNVDLLLRAVGRVAERVPNVSLQVVGEGSDRARLESLATQLGVDQRTRFTGFIDASERDALLAGARVCVCPSSKEGWGLTVIEANAVGTPNVTSDAPGLRDSVRDDETGFLVAEGDESGFAERITALLLDDGLAERISRAACSWSRRFDWGRAAEEMRAAIEGARASAGGRGS
jgi:glycosyltransferase involved in cell wall biosynthesis